MTTPPPPPATFHILQRSLHPLPPLLRRCVTRLGSDLFPSRFLILNEMDHFEDNKYSSDPMLCKETYRVNSNPITILL